MTARLREAGGTAILLVEQHYAFAPELAQGMLVMDRGSVVLAGRADALDAVDVRGRMMV